MHHNYLRGGVKLPYTSPEIDALQFDCEGGFAISNDNLTEENWGWDE